MNPGIQENAKVPINSDFSVIILFISVVFAVASVVLSYPDIQRMYQDAEILLFIGVIIIDALLLVLAFLDIRKENRAKTVDKISIGIVLISFLVYFYNLIL